MPSLLGKSVGEEFAIGQQTLRDRIGLVVEIQDKRIYRANEMMASWTDRFPDIAFVEPVPVRFKDPPELEDLQEISEVLEKVDSGRQQVEGFYRKGTFPISSFARVANRTVFETMTYLLANSELRVKACEGDLQEQKRALTFLDSAREIVLGPSSVASLALLDELDVLGEVPFSYLVTEATLQEIRDLIRRDAVVPSTAGHMGYSGGRLWVTETDPEQEAKRLERLEDVLTQLQHQCTIVGGGDLADFDPDLRAGLLEIFSRSSIEAAAVAAARNVPIWSDDYLLFQALHGELLGIQVWTQVVFIWAAERGLIPRNRRSWVSARMLAHGYDFTSINAQTVLDVCEQSSWQPHSPELAAVLGDFRNRAWDMDSALRMAVGGVSLIWRNAPSEEYASLITVQLLANLLDRPDGRRIVAVLHENVEHLLGLAVVRASTLRKILNHFIEGGIALP